MQERPFPRIGYGESEQHSPAPNGDFACHVKRRSRRTRGLVTATIIYGSSEQGERLSSRQLVSALVRDHP